MRIGSLFSGIEGLELGLVAAGVGHVALNVASFKNGIGYGPWTHIDGWSDNTIRYIVAGEARSE